jgi:hypothetical protein
MTLLRVKGIVECASSTVQWENLRDVIVKLEAATVVGIEERREDRHHSVSIGFKILAGYRNCFKRSRNGREENEGGCERSKRAG